MLVRALDVARAVFAQKLERWLTSSKYRKPKAV